MAGGKWGGREKNRSLIKRVKIAYAEGADYKSELRKYIVAYRNTPHSITGKSPAEMLFGRKLRTKLPHITDVHNDDGESRDRDQELKHSMVEVKNRHRSFHKTVVGDRVLVRRENPSKIQTPFHHEPYRVLEVQGSLLVLESSDGRILRRNISHTKPYYISDIVVDKEDVLHEVARTPTQPVRPVEPYIQERPQHIQERPLKDFTQNIRPTVIQHDDPVTAETPYDGQYVSTPRASGRSTEVPLYLKDYVL